VTAPAAVQADALIAEIEAKVAAARRDLLQAAAREAAEIRRRARAKARRQMRRAVEEMRAHAQRQWQQLRAELQTEEQRRNAARALATLAAAWPELERALERRWLDPQARRRWTEALLALARARLRGARWTIQHPRDFDAARLEPLLPPQVSAVLGADAELHAGLAIEADGARLDGTPAALLADRAAVEAELLAELLAEPQTPPAPSAAASEERSA
jgi:hypothetical protein